MLMTETYQRQQDVIGDQPWKASNVRMYKSYITVT